MKSAVIVNVDDNELSRYARNRLLRHSGFDVHDASTGEEALQAIRSANPDLVMLDVNLPDISGIEVCRRIKSHSDSASVIVLQISATATTAPQATAALENGADTYLVEPVDPDVLVATVRALLRLRNAERDLAASNAALREANRMLAGLNEALARSNRDLERFAHIASHDLQDPLRTVTVYVEMLTRSLSNQLDEKQREFVEFILDGTRRMSSFISDLLAYSRFERDKLELQPVPLDDVVAWALDNLRDKIRDAGAAVHRETLPVVWGDRVQLAQVFQNLIANSLKYRKENEPAVIRIEAERVSPEEWAVCVRDNGIGISPEYHDRIFGPFERLHGRQIPGTGIGLAVCRRIVVENHGGSIWVESEPDKGAAFFVRLKAAPAEQGQT
ncbi:MAG: response regulator [Bryobacteraceae bacterium]|nr:response regulator [Bryobacteraceae bacterium]